MGIADWIATPVPAVGNGRLCCERIVDARRVRLNEIQLDHVVRLSDSGQNISARGTDLGRIVSPAVRGRRRPVHEIFYVVRTLDVGQTTRIGSLAGVGRTTSLHTVPVPELTITSVW